MPVLNHKQRRHLNLLQPLQSTPGESNLGGPFSLPVEFNSKKFASHFAAKGNGVKAVKGTQTLTGTKFTAPGWNVWTYPDTVPTGELDAKGKAIYEDHPLAGKTHEVTEKVKDGTTFVLMFRDLDVQVQVNQAYANLSRDRMTQEARGETVAGANTEDDEGMLGTNRLPRTSEPKLSDFEPPTTVEGDLPANQSIKRKVKKLQN